MIITYNAPTLIGYECSKANLDLRLKPETRTEDGVQYCSYLLCYMDDILHIHQNAVGLLQHLYKSFLLKPSLAVLTCKSV